MVTAQDIEKVEKRFKIRGEIAGIRAVYTTADVDSDAMAAFVQHHVKGTLVKAVPDMDPRIEPALNTLLAHFFLVGVVCGREDWNGANR